VRLELLAASIPDGKEMIGEGVREGDKPGAPSDWDAYDVSLVWGAMCEHGMSTAAEMVGAYVALKTS
jgi:hypothetical protein